MTCHMACAHHKNSKKPRRRLHPTTSRRNNSTRNLSSQCFTIPALPRNTTAARFRPLDWANPCSPCTFCDSERRPPHTTQGSHHCTNPCSHRNQAQGGWLRSTSTKPSPRPPLSFSCTLLYAPLSMPSFGAPWNNTKQIGTWSTSNWPPRRMGRSSKCDDGPCLCRPRVPSSSRG